MLKSPGHLWALDALLDVYPDARIVQTHRDPLKVVASLTSLVSMLRSIASDRIDSLEIGRDWTARLADGLQRVIEVRSRHPGLDGRIFDVRFSDFLGNEIQIVRDLYGHFGLELSGETETRMRRFLGANPSHKHGAHRYVLADAGLHEVEERRRYSAYQERFEVPSEPVH